jgi:hypothetical protein
MAFEDKNLRQAKISEGNCALLLANFMAKTISVPLDLDELPNCCLRKHFRSVNELIFLESTTNRRKILYRIPVPVSQRCNLTPINLLSVFVDLSSILFTIDVLINLFLNCKSVA